MFLIRFTMGSYDGAMQGSLFPVAFEPVADVDVVAVIASAIRAGSAGTSSRSADLLLSTVAAEVVADRLALAGIVMVRWSAPADSGEA